MTASPAPPAAPAPPRAVPGAAPGAAPGRDPAASAGTDGGGPRGLAVITGATVGIGAAFARQLAAAGHPLLLVARDEARLQAVAADLRDRYAAVVDVLAADLGAADGLERLRARLAATQVQLLVNNAGLGVRGTFLDSADTDELQMLHVNVRAVLVATRAVLPAMVARGSGGVLNVSSVAAFVPRGSYAATKAYVTSLTRSLAVELAGTGVQVSAVCPGFTRTEFHDRAGMTMDRVPRLLWLDADTVAATALADHARGKVVSVPGWPYKVLVAVARVLPLAVTGRGAQAGRRFR